MKSNPSLPFPADLLIPQKPPMRVVERLIAREGNEAVLEAALPAESLFAGEDGLLHPAVLLEMIAQGYAALRGWKSLAEGLPPKMGYLTAVKSFAAPGCARAGEQLTVVVREDGSVGDFSIAEGEVLRSGELLARASIRVWTPPDGEGGAP